MGTVVVVATVVAAEDGGDTDDDSVVGAPPHATARTRVAGQIGRIPRDCRRRIGSGPVAGAALLAGRGCRGRLEASGASLAEKDRRREHRQDHPE